MCSGLPDNYSNDITSSILDKQTEYENILIIGGGDLKIAHKLYKDYPLIKKITLCEIDPAVRLILITFLNLISIIFVISCVGYVNN